MNGPFTIAGWRATASAAIAARMNGQHNQRMQAGGSILAASIIAGAVGGTIVGQASIGFLVGVGAGIVMTLIHWLYDRRR